MSVRSLAPFALLFAAPLFAGSAVELTASGAQKAEEAAKAIVKITPEAPDPRSFLFEARPADFSAPAYADTVASLIASYERETGRPLKPGKSGKVALKLYTASGAGLATPKALVDAVVTEMEKRGFVRKNILLLDQSEKALRESGYLPPIREKGNDFNYKGSPVLALDTDKYYDSKPDSPWRWPNPLPSKDILRSPDDFSYHRDDTARYSMLPMPLIRDVDFWINLPVACDNPDYGVSGALANVSLYNVSNAKRFRGNPSNAQNAVVEIAAIAELKDRLAFSILSLQTYQVVGGPKYDAAFCVSENRVWLSANPVILDYLMWLRFNENRKTLRFEPIEPEPIIFVKANTGEVRLGSCRPSDLRLITVK